MSPSFPCSELSLSMDPRYLIVFPGSKSSCFRWFLQLASITLASITFPPLPNNARVGEGPLTLGGTGILILPCVSCGSFFLPPPRPPYVMLSVSLSHPPRLLNGLVRTCISSLFAKSLLYTFLFTSQRGPVPSAPSTTWFHERAVDW